MDVQLPSETPIPIGQRIDELLQDLGQNASWLADKACVEKSTITRIVRGERNPTPETLVKIAPALGISVEQLVVGTNAAGRVDEAKSLISREHYDAAVKQLLEYERKANDLASRVREVEEARGREEARRREADEKRERAERERDQAQREAQQHARDAKHYRDSLQRVVTDLADLQAKVEEGQRTGRWTTALAAVAAVASVANYLRNDSSSDEHGEEGKPKGARGPKAKKKAED